MSEHREPIPSMIYNSAVGGHVTNSQQIIDENLNREQNDINQETVGAVPYNSTTPNGMGRIVLKKTDNFKQVVEAQTNGNTIFVIKYDFTLTDDVTVPANCVLEFDGGSIDGTYTLTGTNTRLNWNGAVIFGDDISFAGSWLCPIISTKMFSDLSFDNALLKVENLNNANIQTTVIIEKESYNYKYNPTNIDRLIDLKSNTEYIINGIIETVFDSSVGNHRILNIQTKKNIAIYGAGELIGNRGSVTGQTGDGIEIYDSENITVNGLKIHGFRADGLYVGCNNEGNNKNVYIKNCNIYNNGRQGISVVAGTNVFILSCYIHDIDVNGAPGYAIDIEPNNRYQGDYVENVYIIGNIIDNHLGIDITRKSNAPIPKNIYIKNNEIINFRKYAINALCADGEISIEGNYIKGYVHTETDFPKWSDAQIYLRGSYIKGNREIINNYIEASVVTFDSIFSNNTVDTIFLSFNNTICTNNEISIRYAGISIPIQTGRETKFDGNKIIVKDSINEGSISSVFSLGSNSILSNNKISVGENITTISGILYCSLNSGELTPKLISNYYPSDVLVAPYPEGYGTHEEINYLGAPHLGTTKPQFIVPEQGRCLNHVGFEFFDTSNNKKYIWNGTAWVDANGNTLT